MADPQAEHESLEADERGRRRTAEQTARLPRGWGAFDRRLVQGTEWVLAGTGTLLVAMITLEVVSRYVFSFSISFVNALARLLLVWLFLLGAGIALRHGAHVGFELIQSALSPAKRRAVVLAGLLLTVVFSLEMLWAGWYAMGPAWAQTEPGLGISLLWPMLAIPAGFALLLYHLCVVAWIEWRGGAS